MRRQLPHRFKYILASFFHVYFAVSFFKDVESRASYNSKISVVPDDGGDESELENFAEPFLSEISGSKGVVK